MAYLNLIIPGNTSQDPLSRVELRLKVVIDMKTAKHPPSGFLEQRTTGSLPKGKVNELSHTFVVPSDAGYTDDFFTPAAFRPCVPDAYVVFSIDIRKNVPGERRPIPRGCHVGIGFLK
jgi:hypothetical protein